MSNFATALDRPCPVCDARIAEWCINGNNWANVHLARADAEDVFA